MKQRPYIFGPEPEPRIGAVEQTADIGVAYEHAFGLAGGAGCVDRIGEVVGPCGRLGVMLRRLDWGVEQKQANARSGEMAARTAPQ